VALFETDAAGCFSVVGVVETVVEVDHANAALHGLADRGGDGIEIIAQAAIRAGDIPQVHDSGKDAFGPGLW
jgi:hypothetical protein